ncbi:ATG7-like protein, partial [Mya arenaria]
SEASTNEVDAVVGLERKRSKDSHYKGSNPENEAYKRQGSCGVHCCFITSSWKKPWDPPHVGTCTYHQHAEYQHTVKRVCCNKGRVIMSESPKALQFAPFSSFLDGGFWHQLCHNKLNVYGLDDSPKPLHGTYFNGDAEGMPCRMSLEHSSFDMETKTPSQCFRAEGNLYNRNTIDDFKTIDKKELLDKEGAEDLKKYHFYYWFGFPCVCPAEDFTIAQTLSMTQAFCQQELDELLENYVTYQSGPECASGYFTLVKDKSGSSFFDSLANTQKHLDAGEKVVFTGKQLRGEAVVMCFRYRSKAGQHDAGHSLVLKVNLSSMDDKSTCPRCVGWEKNERGKLGPRHVNLSASMDPARLAESAVDLNLKLMRWRLLPELDLDTVAKTRCLLLGAGTLGCNVARNLLGWGVRTITLVDNGRVSYSNPVRQTLFVFDDCRSVPGGRPKAEAAAESLKKIFPGVNAEGVSLSIPMPGHTITESAIEQTRADVARLAELVESHDVIFLLLDTRESRWLPTVMAAAMGKTVICTALGFDTFLVMRHGNQSYEPVPSPGPTQKLGQMITGDQLGCYFCNDVVAPGDSTRDRTLDQQCTVSRPGMSFIASALGVELLVSILQHPDKGRAPADTGNEEASDHPCPLGLVPHQIRGFLSRFQQIMPASRAFDKCTACCQKVIEEYRSGGFNFLLRQ